MRADESRGDLRCGHVFVFATWLLVSAAPAAASETITYTYDALGRLSTLSEGANLLDSFTYADNGLVSNRSESSGTTASSAAYTWDDLGRLTGQNDTFTAATSKNVAWTFPRNPASQIASETRDNDSYAFTGITASTKAYVPNGLNQYDRVAGATLLYDLNGNLTSDPGAGTGGTTYVYDVENRLVQAVSGGVTATLTYDPLGRLYQLVKGASDTRFLYDGDAMVTEYNSAGTILNRYAHGSSAAADDPLVWFSGSSLTTKRYLHADHLGSIIAATNGTAAPTINAYDEYGVPSSANVGRFQYTGQVWLGEIGLYYYKARLYSPYVGRFLQTDPVGYQGGINLYAYVLDDPVNAADPSGRTACTGSEGEASTGSPVSSECGPSQGPTKRAAQLAQASAQSSDSNQSDEGPLNALSMPGVGNGPPLRYQPLNAKEQALMNRLLQSTAFRYRAGVAFNRTMIQHREHGFFIWLKPGGNFLLSKIYEGTEHNMGREYSRNAALYGRGSFWATYHVHWGSWSAAAGPSYGDLEWDADYDAIGILANARGQIIYGH